ncbi:MAG: XisI protein [Leptolyngbyaceae cyanobacterium MAG.088]|nr:XisI protein [Leptolyngbyaceae cyanobacterium MAG.088]
MDKLTQYQNAIKQILSDHAGTSPPTDTVQNQLIFDDERGHYQLIYVGWQGKKRVFGPVLHFDIQDGKIWVQYNGTEDPVAQQLVALGVPESDIVLGFHSEFKRQFTPYAVR